MKKQLFALLISVAGAASATNPIILDMLKPHHAPEVRSMVSAFSECTPAKALPEALLAGLGVDFLGDAKRPQFAYAELLEDRSQVVLRGNDRANMETVADGRFVTYGGSYKLRKPLLLTTDVELVGVGELVYVALPRAVVGVSYKFNVPPSVAVKALNAVYGASIKLGSPGAAAGMAWFTADEVSRAVTCWRYPQAVKAG